ncbi:MAG: hypothetical protein J6Z46_04650, partial [Lachnospiraceae bacterium]|nr:hypothetical protein [Lachnospiraceae bacterium]
ELGSHRFIEGFEEGLIGVMEGEHRALNLNFPDYYPNNPDLAGKAVVFRVTVNSITRPVLPELNDEFAQSMGYTDAANLKALYRTELDVRSFRQQVTEQLYYNSKIENLPEDEIKTFSDNMYNSYYEYIASLANIYGMDMDTAIGLALGFSSMAEFREYTDEYALTTVSLQYIYREIATVEGLMPTEEEYNELVSNVAVNYGYESVQALIDENGESAVRNAIITDIVLEYIIKNVNIVY